jgi:hypothetical protein
MCEKSIQRIIIRAAGFGVVLTLFNITNIEQGVTIAGAIVAAELADSYLGDMIDKKMNDVKMPDSSHE